MLPIGLTTIVNNALILLASAVRVDDINGRGSIAAQARDILPIIIPSLLTDHPWNFALRRKEVARSNIDSMAGRWPWAFDLPADCLRWLPWDEEQPEYFDGVEESGQLLCDSEGPIVVRYIANEQDVSRWSPKFVDLVSAELGVRLANAVSASQSQYDRCVMERDNLLPTAKRLDGLASNQKQRLRPHNLSNAVAAMHRRSGGDPRRWHR